MKRVLLAALLALGLSSMAQAAASQDSRTKTVFSNVVVTGTLEVDGAATYDAVINTASATPYAIKIASTTAVVPNGAPSAAGLIAFTNTYVMYVSTGTGAGAWVKIGGQ